jgi:hypothetical protein
MSSSTTTSVSPSIGAVSENRDMAALATISTLRMKNLRRSTGNPNSRLASFTIRGSSCSATLRKS